MKTIYSFLFVVVTMFMLTSCDPKDYTPRSMYHKYENYCKTMDEIEAKKEHSDMFYEKMMDKFCQNHLEECFGVKYVSNSVHINEVVRLDDRVTIKGTHSYKGKLKTYRDVVFYADISEKDRNLFDVKFTKEIDYMIGENGSESQTLTNISYNG